MPIFVTCPQSHAYEVLKFMKVNSEDIDPQTRQALVLGNVEQKAATLLARSHLSLVQWPFHG